MAFNHFVRFVITDYREFKVFQDRLWGFGCLGFLLAFVSGFFLVPLAAIILLFSTIGVVLGNWRLKHEKKVRQQHIPPEVAETWELLIWLIEQRSLTARTHPQLVELLEDLASIRHQILTALKSPSWQSRLSTPEGKQAIRDIETVATTALTDAIFIGRHLFRGKGQREATFARRCADPKFGQEALRRIAEIRDEMRQLATSALEAGGQTDLRSQMLRQRLDAIMDAERELGEPLDLEE